MAQLYKLLKIHPYRPKRSFEFTFEFSKVDIIGDFWVTFNGPGNVLCSYVSSKVDPVKNLNFKGHKNAYTHDSLGSKYSQEWLKGTKNLQTWPKITNIWRISIEVNFNAIRLIKFSHFYQALWSKWQLNPKGLSY